MALAVLGATSMVGVGWIGRDLTRTATPAAQSSTVPSIAVQPTQQGGQETPAITNIDPGTAEPAELVAAALSPAVVQIKTDGGLGSGVVYDQEGLILTNAHVVEDQENVTVVFADGNQVDAVVVGSDPSSDVAVVKLESLEHVVVARLAEDAPKVGQTAIALGSPFGLDQTVTAGIVSAVDRPVADSASTSSRSSSIVINMIQTDAPINPGNSGGALANKAGEVIGINTAIYSESGGNDGIGFAIPIQTAKTVADKIVKGESLDKGSLGVTTKTPTNGVVGAQIVTVVSGGAAAEAGLKRGDVITKIDDTQVRSILDLQARITAHSPGDVVRLEVVRNNETVSLEATLGKK